MMLIYLTSLFIPLDINWGIIVKERLAL